MALAIKSPEIQGNIHHIKYPYLQQKKGERDSAEFDASGEGTNLHLFRSTEEYCIIRGEEKA